MDYLSEDVSEILSELKKYLKTKQVSNLIISPYLDEKVYNIDLSLQKTIDNKNILEALKKQSFNKLPLDEYNTSYLIKMFRKDLSLYNTEEELFASLDMKVRNKIRKSIKSAVRVRDTDDVSLVYQLLKMSSERKKFEIQEEKFYQGIASMENVSLQYSYIDCIAYQKYLIDELNKIKQEESQLLEEKETKKSLKRLKEVSVQLNSLNVRIEEFENMYKSETKEVLLSGAVFIEHENEVIYFLSGSDGRYTKFNGSTGCIWQNMKEAFLNNKKYFNFYGVIEIGQESGNFDFKKSWGGEIVELIGVFECTLNPIYKIIKKFKKETY